MSRRVVAQLYYTPAPTDEVPEPAELAEPLVCTLLAPVRREVGLDAGRILVRVPLAEYESGDYGIDGRWRLRLQVIDPADPSGATGISLGGYEVVTDDADAWGNAQGEDPATDPIDYHAIVWQMELWTARVQRVAGGMLNEGVLNAPGPDGLVDTSGDDYLWPSQLAQIAMDASGLPYLSIPASLNTPYGTETAISPGPLDWSNARAVPELVALVRRYGHELCVTNDGELVEIVRLRRAGEDIDFNSPIFDTAEPFTLRLSLAPRSQRVLVTSGATRTTIITERTLSDLVVLDGEGEPTDEFDGPYPRLGLEWCAFDDRTGAWLTGPEWADVYPDEVAPGDINAFRAGPSPDAESPNNVRAFGRLFTAVRLAGEDRERSARFVTLPSAAGGLATHGGGASAYASAAGIADLGKGQYGLAPLTREDAAGNIRLGPAVAVAGEGVFRLPGELTYARFEGGVPSGGYANTRALEGDELLVAFAHEAQTGDWYFDFVVKGFRASVGAGAIELTEEEVREAYADVDTVKVEAPWLQRVAVWGREDQEPSVINEAAVTDAARRLATAELASGRLVSGPVTLVGLINVQPGAIGGAVTAVTWDPFNNRTTLEINQHELADWWIDRARADAARSAIRGLGSYTIPGIPAAAADVGSGEPQARAGTRAAGPQERARDRGFDASKAPRKTDDARDYGAASRMPPTAGIELMARLTAAEPSETLTGAYEYTWEEVTFDGEAWSHPAGARSGLAVNIREFGDEGQAPTPVGTLVQMSSGARLTREAEPPEDPMDDPDPPTYELIWIFEYETVAAPRMYRVTGSAADGDNRWVYTAVELVKTEAGPDAWEETGDPIEGVRNTYEVGNTSSGVQGNGVDVSTLPTGFALQPVRTGLICPGRRYTVLREVEVDPEDPEYDPEAEPQYEEVVEVWITEPNAVDGVCEGDE